MTFLVFYLKSSSLNFLMKHVFIATFCSYLLIVVSMYIQFRNSTKLSLIIIVFFIFGRGVDLNPWMPPLEISRGVN